jgi:hypothetical protein
MSSTITTPEQLAELLGEVVYRERTQGRSTS